MFPEERTATVVPLRDTRIVSAERLGADAFEGCAQIRAAGLLHHLPLRRVEAGAELDVDGGLAIVIDGRGTLDVRVGDDGLERHVLRLVTGGDFLVPAARVPGERTHTLFAAHTRSQILVVGTERLDTWMRVPTFAAVFARAMYRAVGDGHATVAVARNARVDRRLTLTLQGLAERFGRVTPDGLRLDLRLTHLQLSRLIGSARESVTLALQRLAERGEVTLEDGALLLPPLICENHPRRHRAN